MKKVEHVFWLSSIIFLICHSYLIPLENFDISTNEEYKQVSAQELLDKIDLGQILYLIDCRPEREFNAGHIPGAVNVSINSLSFNKDTLVQKRMKEIQKTEERKISFVLIDEETGEAYIPYSKLRELIVQLPQKKDQEVILYCRRPSCTRSPLAAEWILSLGYEKVYRYAGGWEEWSEKKYPVKNFEGLGNPKAFKLADNVFAVEGLYHSKSPLASVNAGIIMTPESVIFIDSGMSISSAEYLLNLARKKMSGQKKFYLILTHSHSDHVFGMRVMKDRGAEVIGHSKTAEHLKDDNGEYIRFIIDMDKITMEQGKERYGHVVLFEPDRYVDDDLSLNIDGEEIHLLVTPGHTPDSICVYHPASKTLFAGDSVYSGLNPSTRFGGPDEWKQWISHLERLKSLEINKVVPGHGYICGLEAIDQNILFLKKEIDKTLEH